VFPKLKIPTNGASPILTSETEVNSGFRARGNRLKVPDRSFIFIAFTFVPVESSFEQEIRIKKIKNCFFHKKIFHFY
tara:strand:+ start:1310 stop:1540 length:231 start_codon:yes stop_codon:yes gene_type:complete